MLVSDHNIARDYTVRQVSQLFQISMKSVYDLLSDGKLDSFKVSERGTRISQKHLDRFKANGGV